DAVPQPGVAPQLTIIRLATSRQEGFPIWAGCHSPNFIRVPQRRAELYTCHSVPESSCPVRAAAQDGSAVTHESKRGDGSPVSQFLPDLPPRLHVPDLHASALLVAVAVPNRDPFPVRTEHHALDRVGMAQGAAVWSR